MQDFIEAELEKLNQLGEGRVRFMGVRQEFNDFLRSHDQRLIAKIVEMVEGEKKTANPYKMNIIPNTELIGVRHYNEALEDILTLLK